MTTETTHKDTSWRARAACRHVDTELFFGPGRGRSPVEALRVCVGCPVRGDCLGYALAQLSGVDLGVWGGTTEAARRAIRAGEATAEEAMAAGDRLAAGTTYGEQLAAAEPWLRP